MNVRCTGVVGVVPTYNPDPSALGALVELLGAQVEFTISDDGSSCTVDSALALCAAHSARVIRHESNAGIARGLNDGLSFAHERGASWLLTVDQDSMISPDHVMRMLAVVNAAGRMMKVGAVGAGRVEDTAGTIRYPVRRVDGIPTTPEVIQTGTLWNVVALSGIGGFDESLGIDAVDAAACVRLRAAGFSIVLAPDVTVVHSIGESRSITVLGRQVSATGHSAERRTSMVRNRVRLLPEEFAQDPVHALRTLRRLAMGTLLAVTVEDDRWAKAKASAKGLLPTRQGH